MKLYFSSKHIPGLQHLPLTTRLEVLQQAHKRLSGPEKLMLNVLKLLILIPLFIVILQISSDWLAIVWALLLVLLYPLLIKPILFGLCAKYLSQTSA